MESEKLKEELTWRCLVCMSFSGSVFKLREHVSRHAFNVPVYQCKTCKQYFNDKRSLLSHKRNVHGDNLGQGYTYNRSYICPLCGRRFSKKTACVDHLLGHGNMKHECKECGWMFDTSYRLYVHGEFWHASPGKHHTSTKQNQNGVSVQNSETFDASRKVQENHNLESKNSVSKVSRKKYRCAWKRTCSAVMDTYDELTTHMKVFHGVQNRTCPICSRNLADNKRLEYHVQHHFEMAFICLHFHCGQMFEKWGVLQSHYTTNHKKSIKTINQLKYMVRKRRGFNGEKHVVRKLKSSCPICHRSFYDDYKLQYHVEHHCLLRYRCPDINCHYMYEIYENLQAHCSLRHGVKLSVTDLDRCTVTAAEIRKQRNELDTSLEDAERINKNRKCEMCGRYFIADVDFNNHMENHENMQFKCPQRACGWEYERFDALYSHCYIRHKMTIRRDQHLYLIREGTNGTRTFRCTHQKCTFNVPDAFSGYDKLVLHLKTSHGPKDYKCPLCSRNLMSRKDFDEHTKNHDNMKYKCPEQLCGWTYKLFSRLYAHCYTKHKIKIKTENTNVYLDKNEEKRTEVVVTQSETNSEDYACPTCNRVFKSQTKFYHHIENHASMKYKCKCGWEFTDFKSLQVHHQEVHKSCLQISRADEPWYRLQRVDSEATTGRSRTTRSRRRSIEVEEPKQRKYPCPFLKCEAGYQDFNEFERHLRFVHKKVSGTCALCDRVFNNRLEFRVHLQKHIEGTTWFKCLYDGWMYHDLSSLRKHFRVDHKILKFPDEDDYHVVQDAVLGDDDSTSAYEDSNESDSDDGKVEPADQDVVKSKVDHSKPVDFQTLSRRRSTHIRCAFCNMTFDMDLELEEHACYRDIFITATEVKESVEKGKETGDSESGTCTVEVHAAPRDQVVRWGGSNSDKEQIEGTSEDVAELKTEAPDSTNDPSNLYSRACQQGRNGSSLREAPVSLKCQNTIFGTLPSSQESGIEMNVKPLVSSSQDKKPDRPLIGINGSESVEPSLQVPPLLHLNGFSSPNSAG